MSTAAVLLMLSMLSGPRSFGHFIGDEFVLEAQVAWEQGFALEQASLPRPGPVTYWLELKAVESEEIQASHYRLRFRYQTFYAPLGVQTLEVPGFILVAKRDDQRVEKRVQGWSFSMSPLRGLGPRSGDDTVLIRQDVAPPSVSLARYVAGGIACVLVAIATFLGLAFHRAWGPFARRGGRPFAQALRTIHRQPENVEGYLAGLLSLHRAFDSTAGRRVLMEDLGEVLRMLPRFAPAAEDIRSLFRASQRAFFGEDPEAAMANLPRQQLILLGERLARAERGSS